MTLAKYRLSEPKLEFPHSKILTLLTCICNQFETKCHILRKGEEYQECFGQKCRKVFVSLWLSVTPSYQNQRSCSFLSNISSGVFCYNPRVPALGSVSWSVSQHPTCWPVSPDLKQEQQEGQTLLQLEFRKNPCIISYLLGITFHLSPSLLLSLTLGSHLPFSLPYLSLG